MRTAIQSGLRRKPPSLREAALPTNVETRGDRESPDSDARGPTGRF